MYDQCLWAPRWHEGRCDDCQSLIYETLDKNLLPTSPMLCNRCAARRRSRAAGKRARYLGIKVLTRSKHP